MATKASNKKTTKKNASTVKSTASQSKPKLQKEKKEVNPQKIAIILFAVAAFLFAFIFIQGESVWKYLHHAFFGLFGLPTYVLWLAPLYLAIVFSSGKSVTDFKGAFIAGGFVVVLACSLLSVFGFPSKASELDIFNEIKQVWIIDSKVSGGGTIGIIVGGLVAKLFGKTAAIVSLLILLLVCAMFFTGTTISGLILFLKKPIISANKFSNERFEKRASTQINETSEDKCEIITLHKKSVPPTVDDSKPLTEVNEQLPPKREEYEIPLVRFVEQPTVYVPSLPDGDIVTRESNEFSSEPATPESIEDTLIYEDISSMSDNYIEQEEPELITGEQLTGLLRDRENIVNDNNTDENAEYEDIYSSSEFINNGIDAEFGNEYKLPSIDCLDLPDRNYSGDDGFEEESNAQKLIETLESFKISAQVTEIVRGPSVTRYELVPDAGVRINKITTLSDDLAMRMAAKSIRIEAPIPGKAAIGIEVPNRNKSMVSMREIIDTPQYSCAQSKLNVALGKDITGNIICADLAKMPHLLVAGTTGSGKSVCLNSMIISILYNAKPDEVKLLMIDPKMVEFTIYNGIAHLEVPVVSNPRKAAGALSWAVSEMERRYKQFSENSVRDIKGYNLLSDNNPEIKKMHQIVIFIDELSDLMMAAPKEVEDSICRLAQMARAAGIHLVIATQRPSTDVITGIIKANIPSRIALFVSSQIDSRTILDHGGAEKLLGNGDMLFSPVGSSKPVRLQGCYISDSEVERVVSQIKAQSETEYNDDVMKEIEANAAATGQNKKEQVDVENELDPMFDKAAELVVEAGAASTTMLQKRLKLGYARASRVMDQLEENGIVGPADGSKPRQVLISKQDWYEQQALSEAESSDNFVENDGLPFDMDDILDDEQ